MKPLTSAQQSFLDQMRMNRIDHRALSIIEAAFNVRNAEAIGLELRDLRETCDKVAG